MNILNDKIKNNEIFKKYDMKIEYSSSYVTVEGGFYVIVTQEGLRQVIYNDERFHNSTLTFLKAYNHFKLRDEHYTKVIKADTFNRLLVLDEVELHILYILQALSRMENESYIY